MTAGNRCLQGVFYFVISPVIRRSGICVLGSAMLRSDVRSKHQFRKYECLNLKIGGQKCLVAVVTSETLHKNCHSRLRLNLSSFNPFAAGYRLSG